jgi:two-component system, OmpR family, response regulator
MTKPMTTIFLVDDDMVFLKMMQVQLMEDPTFKIQTFPTGEKCLANLSVQPDIIILDFHLNGIEKEAKNGLETLDLIREFNKDLPVIMLSSQDKIEVAISCMHHGAMDYIVKSETAFFRVKQAIDKIIQLQKMKKKLDWYMTRM